MWEIFVALSSKRMGMKMKIHLAKSYKGIGLNGLACINNLFVKGRIVDDAEFLMLGKVAVCKRCAEIFTFFCI